MTAAAEERKPIGRRAAIATFAGAVLAWPLAARAQQPKAMRRIGVLMAYPADDAESQSWVAAFREELQKLGWTEGRNVQFDYRWATAEVERQRQPAIELVALQPDLILSSSTPTTATLLTLTRTIPIVFANIVDPIGQGFIASIRQPGGNVTGFINLEPTMSGKFVELLKEIAPRDARVTIFFNPATAPYSEIYLGPFRAAAKSLGVEGLAAPVASLAELDAVFAAQALAPNGGLIAMPDGFANAHRAEVTALASRYGLPAIYPSRAFAEAGGLMSYGNDIRDNYRHAATYADRILRGEAPANLPAQYPTKFEMVINLKTAKALGLEVPAFLQQNADEVIE
jgi:putative tryptophan/tyrosine transport system substrate-binding protein